MAVENFVEAVAVQVRVVHHKNSQIRLGIEVEVLVPEIPRQQLLEVQAQRAMV
jgi:hypothetical protein